MSSVVKNNKLRVAVAVVFLLMVLVNFLANAIPLNGLTTGQISDRFQNLFAPAGITFAIWGLIYLLLALFTVYQFGIFSKQQHEQKKLLIERVSKLFIVSSVANIIWIFAWHYLAVPLSLIMIVVMLICLILIQQLLNRQELSVVDYICMRLPFSIYFGWITVATIANVTVLLVSIGWNGVGIPESFWTALILVVGLGISVATMFRFHDFAYGLVIIWAYTGILIRHVSETMFAGRYPLVIITVVLCLALLLVAHAYLISKTRFRWNQ